MPCQRFIVAAPSDIKHAEESGMRTIGLNYRISVQGRLEKSSLFRPQKNGIMGISDKNMTYPPENTESLCSDIYYEAKALEYSGVLLDFENTGAGMYPFVSALSYSLAKRGINHFVPERFHSAAPLANLVIECAVTGGSFEELYLKCCAKYVEKRVNFEIFPICSDFIIPAFDAAGKPLLREQFDFLVGKYNPSVFFSEELLAKYFTYTGEDGSFHFVVFDDETTMREKIAFFDKKNISSVFLLYSDWKNLSSGL